MQLPAVHAPFSYVLSPTGNITFTAQSGGVSGVITFSSHACTLSSGGMCSMHEILGRERGLSHSGSAVPASMTESPRMNPSFSI
ncbi:MAG: hypothetical protein ACYC7D_04380 [Nitrososphaerales archaeon]